MNRHLPLSILLFSLLAGLPVESRAGEPRWFKGNTHTHSLWSDGNDFPEMIAAFYKRKGYQFLILSDHNVLSRGDKWLSVDAVEKRRQTPGKATMKKYLDAFGKEWVELRGDGDKQSVRLKTLEEIRPKFEVPGKFLFIEGEEITDRFERHQIHINALNTGEAIKPQHGDSVRATIRNNIIAVREQSERLNRPILAHLNHPNFQWSVTTRIIGTRRGNEDDPAKVGEILATITGTRVNYKLGGDESYVRTTITSDKAHPVPSFSGQMKEAWTQPVWKRAAAK